MIAIVQASSVFAPSALLSASWGQGDVTPADLGTLLGSAEQTPGGLVADTNRVGLLVPLQQPGAPLVSLYMHSYSAAPSGLLFRLYLSGFLDS